MAGQMSLMLRADPAGFEEGIDSAVKAIRDWETQTGVSADNAADKLEEAIRAVITLGRQTDRSSDDIKRALQGIGLSAGDAEDAIAALENETADVGRKAPRDLERAEDAVDDLADAADKAGEKTADISDKAGEAGEGLRSLGDIAKSALEGDLGGAISSAGEALGGFAGALGGGAIGGAIGSAIGGIVSSWVTHWQKAAEESEARINALADKIISANGRIDESFIMSGVGQFLTDQERMAEVAQIMTATGLDQVTVLRALNGDMADQDAVTRELAGAQDELTAARRRNLDEGRSMNEGLGEQNQELLKAKDVWSTYSSELDEATSRYDVFAEAQRRGAERMLEAAVAAGEATKSIDEVGNTVYALPDGKTVTIDAETGEAKGDIDAINQMQLPDKTTTIRINVDDSAWRNWRPSAKQATVHASPLRNTPILP